MALQSRAVVSQDPNRIRTALESHATGIGSAASSGHSAVFFGPKSKHVLFFVGYDQIPYVAAIDGATPARIKCAPTYKTWPRVCLDGRGAVLGASLRNGQPEYDVIFIDFENQRATTIASLGCDNATFQAPSTIKRDQ